MGEDIGARLRRLGVTKGVHNLKPAPGRAQQGEQLQLTQADGEAEPDERGPAIDVLLPGIQLVETDLGACFVLDKVYPLSYQHGSGRLADLTTMPMDAAAVFCRDDRLAALAASDFVFLDTETTGLVGAGTIAFMVGVAFFEDEALVVRQYFLRDHGDEPAMLQLFAELLAQKPGLISFNGRSFDLPLLDNRYVLNRLDGVADNLLERPHIDLLPPSRRLWRRRVGSCALSSLEKNVLGLRRTQEDVPGWLIPNLYFDYLRTGDARELLRVFYHNRIDMLSMVALASQIMRQFARPQIDDQAPDLLSLARWQGSLGMTDEAEASLRLVAAQDLPLELYHQALHHLGVFLKRDGRREEAVQLWQQIAVAVNDEQVVHLALAAHVELAKHYEWQHRDLQAAHEWTKRALTIAADWEAAEAELMRAELDHRLARLERKLGQKNKG